jgi:hypothetical protein
LEFTARGPIVHRDETYPEHGPCPFETLRSHVREACTFGEAILVCDDTGGVACTSSADEYDAMVVEVDMIRPESHLFIDPVSLFPWRYFHILAG